MITQGLSEEFSEIASNNSRLTQVIEQAQQRSSTLDKKLEKKRKYEALVKHCQRLQCNSCAKLYTPVIFATHYKLCQKQQQIRGSNNGVENSNKTSFMSKVEVQVEEVDQNDYHLESEAKEEFVARVVDIKKVLVDSKEDLISEGGDSSSLQEVIYTNSDELVNIMGCQTLARQQLG